MAKAKCLEVVAFLWLPLIVSCAGERVAPAIVTDSAGVEIVLNRSLEPTGGGGWVLEAEPFFEVGGGLEPEMPLLRVTAVTPRGDGGVAVGMNAPAQVLLFDGEGSLRSTFGGPGGGPGEYASVFSVVNLPADSLGVWDPIRRRLTVFDGHGQLARSIDFSATVPIPVGAAAEGGVESGFTRLLHSAAGTLILFGEGAVRRVDEAMVARPAMPAHWVDRDGNRLSTSPPIPGMQVLLGNPIGPIPIPFGARTYGVAAGDQLVVGTAEEPEFSVFGSSGALARIVRWPELSPRQIAGPHLTAWSALAEQWIHDAGPIGAVLETLPRADRFPAYMDIISSDRGEVFVGEYPGPIGVWPMRRQDDSPDILRPTARVPERAWLVFDSTGTFLSRFRTEEGFEPYLVRGDEVWGVFVDDLDIESVRAYHLHRR